MWWLCVAWDPDQCDHWEFQVKCVSGYRKLIHIIGNGLRGQKKAGQKKEGSKQFSTEFTQSPGNEVTEDRPQKKV